ncbi:flavodoxin domain-containing protein [Brachyspira murdochii]|uniref:Flavodoxin/nitric oxide synthase n=2 Tax=Brachyspira murdochii TaxID=84378 RepID=D5U6R7_BRAM5|nr:flavodoxin domain-containing protein [Brachyspira murdochii]ADG70633.1 flavodoxin/nitric oxide synthase [Brachyspira murdochii DSM 12563]PPS20658.1 flavodoxin [Brachyspira murdochii]
MSTNIAVLYKSKYGTTRTYAKWIADKVHGDLYGIDNVTIENLNNYDFIVFAGALYAGKLSSAKRIKQFFNKLKGDKHLYCVIVGLGDTNDKELYNNAVNQNFKSDIKDHMKFYFLRGGVDFDKLKLHHALMMHMLRRIISAKAVKTEDEKLLLENYGKKIDFINKSAVEEIVLDIKNKSKELQNK